MPTFLRLSPTNLSLSLLLLATSAHASIPSGRTFGAWRVVSISSISGAAGDDASALLTQETDAGEIEVRWDQGGSVVVSIHVNDCYEADQDFSQHYFVDTSRWLQLSDGGGARLQSDIATWLGQARLACRGDTRLHLFQSTDIQAAAADFSERVRWFSGVS